MKIKLLLLFIVSLSFSAETYYCVQLVSSKNLNHVKRLIKRVSTFPDVRIEKIGNYYVLRAGFFRDIRNAKKLERRAKDIFRDAFSRRCAFLPERILIPSYKPKRKKVYTYEVGMRLARIFIKKGKLEKAEEIYRELAELYPDSREVKLQLARVLFWQGRYEESLKIYKELEKFEPTLADERRRVEIKKIMEEVDRLEKEGKLDEAIKILEELYKEEKNYTIGMKLGTLYLKMNRREEASRVFSELRQMYPEDKDIERLYEISVKKNLKGNYVRLGLRYFWYERRKYRDREVFVNTKFSGILGGSLVGTFRLVNRFNKENSQFALEFYRRIGRGYWGYLSGDLSPEADFLPEYSLGGGVFRSLRRAEVGSSFRFMRFSTSRVLLIIPSATIYLPNSLYHTLNLYFNVERSTYTLLNRLTWDNGTNRLFASFSFGTSSERLQAGEDFVRYSTYSLSLGGELRIRKRFGLGGGLYLENREGLYRRYGLEGYGRFWW